MAELRDEEGRIYGRARIEADAFCLSSGLITVDGLASATIGLVSGILVGVEDTASRNPATPTVPAPVLASWASGQAITVANSEVSEVEKAKTAEVVLA